MSTPAVPATPDYSPETFGELINVLKRSGPLGVGLYTTLDNRLFVRSVCSLAGVVVQVTARILTVTGREIICTYTHAPNSNRSAKVDVFDIAEGYVLGVTAWVQNVAVLRGQCYVMVGLGRGNAASVILHDVLIAEYVSSVRALRWPGDDVRSSTDGPGVLRSIALTPPGLGLDVSEAVPAGARWSLQFGWVFLSTSATVANRVVVFRITDGVTRLFAFSDANNQAANGNTVHGFFNSVSNPTTGIDNGFWISIPATVLMLAGWKLITATTSLQAGDQFSQGQYSVIEWLEA